jgi:hypothetical protein
LLETAIFVRRSHKLHNTRDGKIQGLLVEGMGGNLEKEPQIVHLALENRQEVSAADILDRRGLGVLFVLAGTKASPR